MSLEATITVKYVFYQKPKPFATASLASEIGMHSCEFQVRDEYMETNNPMN